jgi:guanylate kinase
LSDRADAGLLLVMTGPSGAGKTTLSRRVMAEQPDIAFSVSYTTRPPRAGEVEGVDYHFVDAAEFDRRLAAREFLEHARVHGNLYGTHRPQAVERVAAGGVVLLDIDVQGARQVRASGIDAVFLFVLPPSHAELERRLRHRGTDAEDVIARRLGIAQREMAEAPWFHYLVVNDDLDRATGDFLAVVRAERVRRGRPAVCRSLDLSFS